MIVIFLLILCYQENILASISINIKYNQYYMWYYISNKSIELLLFLQTRQLHCFSPFIIAYLAKWPSSSLLSPPRTQHWNTTDRTARCSSYRQQFPAGNSLWLHLQATNYKSAEPDPLSHNSTLIPAG